MNAHPAPVIVDRRARRGVLLLVVLSLLTLFLMLGAAYVVSATRAREAARAYARLTFAGDETRVPHARVLDAILMRVVRGGAAPTATTTVSFESLLADKYGAATLEGTATGFNASAPTPPVLVGTLTFASPVRPFDLTGRLVSFVEPGRPVTTHRIIRAQQTDGSNSPTPTVTVAIAASTRPGPFVGVKASTRAIVNGREFAGVPALSGTAPPSNEPWDGFDFHNPFLAQLGPGATISTADVSRISYFPSFAVGTLSGTFDNDGDLIPDAADNDNDGVYDGLFMDFGIPDVNDANGNTVNVRASVLIVDLDGRFNVNAHDALPRLVYAGTSGWTTLVSQSIPIGSGYGPAEVNGMSGARRWTGNSTWTSGTGLFTGPPTGAPLATGNTFATSEHPTVFTLTGGPAARFVGVRTGTCGSRFAAGESTPQLTALEGRYGERAPASWQNIVAAGLAAPSSASFAVPGRPDVDDEVSRMNDRRADASRASSIGYGVPSIWWSGTDSAFDWRLDRTIAGALQPTPRGTFNSPPDLHGRMRTVTGTAATIVPQLGFAKAQWAGTTTTGTWHESKDDPYELRLDTRLGFGGVLFDPTAGGSLTSTSSVIRDNPFTAAELEPVLRPYDIDANRLPPRLPAMLGSVGEEARLKVTTDSWDTTAITGSAATVLSSWVAGASGVISGTSPMSGVIGGDAARGERFDLNRPLAAADGSNTGYPAATFPSGTYHLQRAAYCKDLYTLLRAYSPSGSAKQLAQWAANVAEFRDADSRIVPFEYDANPLNGWDVDGNVTTPGGGADRGVVWGAERPEIVIQETFAWRNASSGSSGMVITLHRPWHATAYGTGSTTSIPAEPCDYALDSLSGTTTGRPLNAVNLGKKPCDTIYGSTYSNADALDVSGTVYPIWRLRIVAGGTQFVAFTGTSSAWLGAPSITSTSGAPPRMGSDSSFTVFTGSAVMTGTVGGSGTVFVAPPAGSLEIPTLTLAGAVTGTVYLERLSDPTVRLTINGTVSGAPSVTGSMIWNADPLVATGTTWPVAYLVVDEMPLQVVSTSGATSLAATWNVRGTTNANTAFWGQQTTGAATVAASGTFVRPSVLNPGSTAWLPWPNRPFVSSAELLLVPQGSANEILQNYRRMSPALSGSVQLGWSIPVATDLLLDAVHVPTRFAGIHGTTTQNLPSAAGIDGMVTTVNQLSSFREPGRVNLNTVVSDDVWNAVVAGPLLSAFKSRTAASLASSPARTMVAALALAGGATGTVEADTTSPQLAVNLNPLHGIYTATRLANTVTPRSNVFAVWITLRESVASDPDSVRYRRAFYIVDRSIPVAFQAGSDTNVWDCVRVRRIIE